MPTITPFLWFAEEAEEAAAFYTSIFKDSRVTSVSHYGAGAPLPKGTVMMVEFELEGQRFVAFNAGPRFKFNESISFAVSCESQAEIDGYWYKLLEGGGKPQACGWLKDRYGLSWQIMPAEISKLMTGPNAERVMQALWGMIKLDLQKLRAAAQGK